MRAVECSNAELDVAERPEPVPGRGQVRLEVLRCGICGSDLHARHGLDQWADLAARAGYDRFGARTSRSCSATSSAARSPSTARAAAKAPTGTPVVALPLLRRTPGVDTRRPVGPRARRLRRADRSSRSR